MRHGIVRLGRVGLGKARQVSLGRVGPGPVW